MGLYVIKRPQPCAGSFIVKRVHHMPHKPKRTGWFKRAAVEVLRNANEPLSSVEITQIAHRRGLLTMSRGKTPTSTMAAFLFTDVRKKNSVFSKVDRGKFALKASLETRMLEVVNAFLEASSQITREAPCF